METLESRLVLSFIFAEMHPLGGPVGTTVSLSGTGFEAGADYDVTIGGTAAVVESISSDEITFRVASGTPSGDVVLSDGTHDISTGMPFAVTRRLSGTLDLPAAVTRAGYELVAGFHSTSPFDEDGSFSLEVPQNQATIVWAFREVEDPVFGALVTSANSDVTINAESTARMLAFLSPLLLTRNDARATLIQNAMQDLEEANGAAALIRSLSADGFDPFQDARVQLAVEELLLATLAASPPDDTPVALAAFDDDTPAGTVLREINPNYATSQPATDVRLDSQLRSTVSEDVTLEIDTIHNRSNPLDWLVEVIELVPSQFSAGFDTLADERLTTHGSTFEFLDERPVANGFVSAVLDSEKADLIGRLAKFTLGWMFESAELTKSNEFTLDKNIPAVYVTQAFSGNLWYGTRAFLPQRNQVNLLASEDVNDQWIEALTMNIVIGAIDAASAIVPFKQFVKTDAVVDLIETTMDLVKNSLNIVNQSNGLDRETVELLFQEVTTAVGKAFYTIAVDNFGELISSPGRFFRVVGKTVGKAINVTGKISSAEQFVERFAGLGMPNALAIERSLIVVGDPFHAVIDGLSPRTGQEGETVVIQGRNFGDPLPDGHYTEHPNEDLEVSFCQFAETSTERRTPSSASLTAEIQTRTTTQISVTVPEDFANTFSDAPVYVCINKNSQESSSRHLRQEGEFTLLDPPTISRIASLSIVLGGSVYVEGNQLGQRTTVIIDDTLTISPFSARDNYLSFRLPDSGLDVGEHTLKIRRGSRESAPVPFTVEAPAAPPAPDPLDGGWSITVSRLDMSNVADGQISFLEAMLLASNGTLGRPLELHRDCELKAPHEDGSCPRQNREEDLVSNFLDSNRNQRPGGAGFSDSVTVSASLAGQTMFVSAAGLPPVGNGDRLNLNHIVLDGAQAPSSAHGLILDGASNARVENVHIQNFSGDGIRLANESRNNTFNRIVVENVGGHGVSLFDGCQKNSFSELEINDTRTGHGILLTGESNFNEFYNTQLSHLQGSGIRLEGSSANVFQGPRIPDIDAFDPNVVHPGSHGIHLSDGSAHNRFSRLGIHHAGRSGIYLQGDAKGNRFSRTIVMNSTAHGLHLDGDQVGSNTFYSRADAIADPQAAWGLDGIYTESGGYGILVENGAKGNLIAPQRVWDNEQGGIKLSGLGTNFNVVGKHYLGESIGIGQSTIRPSLIYDNRGHGIHVSDGASRNAILTVNVAGNGGNGVEADGILVDGYQTNDNSITGIWTGFQYFVKGDGVRPFANPNSGNSVRLADGAQGNTIGGHSIVRNSLANDMQNAVLIEGVDTAYNIIQDTAIGLQTDDGPFHARHYAGPGKNGIVVRNGAHDNLLGGIHSRDIITIDGVPDAAILIEGEGTDNNVVVGCYLEKNWGRVTDHVGRRNRIGIHIRDGAKGNRIGQPGPLQGPHPNPLTVTAPMRELNVISATELGVWIEDAGGEVDAEGNRQSPNVLQNNIILAGGVGLKISGRSVVNDIGGTQSAPKSGFVDIANGGYTLQENIIASSVAAVHLDRVMIADPRASNRFLNNIITSDTLTGPNVDLRDGPPDGVGVLFTESTGNVFGESIRTSNLISGTRVGVYIDGGGWNSLIGNEIMDGNELAGIVLHNSQENRIGNGTSDGTNRVLSNGFASDSFPADNPDISGILIVGGEANRVMGNDIANNAGAGILVVDSAENVLGGVGRTEGNVITENRGSGIVLDGRESRNNVIQRNWIGSDRNDTPAGNGENGIQLRGQASSNLIGGSAYRLLENTQVSVRGPNIISHNNGHGVEVTGEDTNQNSILSNSIFANAGLGIYNENQGNHELPPPVHVQFDNDRVTGEVTSIIDVPPGSRIEVFADNGVQGESYLGSTAVRADGSWDFAVFLSPALDRITVNVTHAVTRSTSEFTVADQVIGEGHLTISRPDGEPVDRTLNVSSGDIAVLPIRLEAYAEQIQIRQLVLDVTDGTLVENSDLSAVLLYRDNDLDGHITNADSLLADGFFETDDGSVTLAPQSVIQPHEPQNWMVVYRTNGALANGTTMGLQIRRSTSATVVRGLSGQPAMVRGNFPITSDRLTIDVGISSEIQGAIWDDADGDGVKDDAEQGLSGWTIYLDMNNNGRFDEDDRATQSDADGDYVFQDLLEATYSIREIPPEGWVQTFPNSGEPQTVVLGTNETVAGVNFGNQRSNVDPPVLIMTAEEQLLVELINRARLDPNDEAARFGIDLNQGLPAETISTEPKPPLAPHSALLSAAWQHSEEMLQYGYFSTTNRDGQSPRDRARELGYGSENVAIAIAAWWESVDATTRVYHRHRDLFISPHEREHMLLSDYREVGTGVRHGEYTFQGVTHPNATLVTELYGSQSGHPVITGVAYTDIIERDEFYSVGEGAEGIIIVAVNQETKRSFQVMTGPSGGYTLNVPPGTYVVTANGRAMRESMAFDRVVVDENNVKVDFRIAARPGDSNLDGVFSSEDLILVFQAGEYEDEEIGNSTWHEGDWNGDHEFDTRDLILAFAESNYESVAPATATSRRTDDIARSIDSDVASTPIKNSHALISDARSLKQTTNAHSLLERRSGSLLPFRLPPFDKSAHRVEVVGEDVLTAFGDRLFHSDECLGNGFATAVDAFFAHEIPLGIRRNVVAN